jgi:hypothetical protein
VLLGKSNPLYWERLPPDSRFRSILGITSRCLFAWST